MAFEEKLTWVSAAVALIVSGVYFYTVLGQVGSVPTSEIAYQRPLLIAIGASVVLTIVGAIGAAIGTAISAEITGNGSVDDVDRKDERDVLINRRGELIGCYVSSFGMLGVLALTMLEYDYFWIANALYLALMVGSLVGSTVKLVEYRRGF